MSGIHGFGDSYGQCEKQDTIYFNRFLAGAQCWIRECADMQISDLLSKLSNLLPVFKPCMYMQQVPSTYLAIESGLFMHRAYVISGAVRITWALQYSITDKENPPLQQLRECVIHLCAVPESSRTRSRMDQDDSIQGPALDDSRGVMRSSGRRSPSPIWLVLFLLLLVNLTNGISNIPLNRLLERRLCRAYYGSDRDVDEKLCKVVPVQQDLAYIMGSFETLWVAGGEFIHLFSWRHC